MNNYGYHVFWSPDDAAYIATSPEFDGLSAFGAIVERGVSTPGANGSRPAVRTWDTHSSSNGAMDYLA